MNKNNLITKQMDSKICKFKKFVENLPEPERKRVILFVKGEYLNWFETIKELNKNNELFSTIEKYYKTKERANTLSENDWQIVEKRLNTMPKNMGIGIVSRSFTKEELILEVKNKTEVGMAYAKMQIKFVRWLLGQLIQIFKVNKKEVLI
jgi:hypothetical protein